jgi:nucleoside-diphosphate-sugar epimerase
MNDLENKLVDYDINAVIHNVSILSAAGEQNPQLAWETNVQSAYNVLEAARIHGLSQVLIPSSIAAFGPSTPRENTPNDVIMRPTTMYGVTKVVIELLGEYYARKFNVDFRSLRYPGIISSEALPGGGTTDYAVAIFYEAIRNKRYTSFLSKDTRLPMMYMPDCTKSTIDLIEADAKKLVHRTFNVTAVSFTPEELANEIKKIIPDFQIDYKPDFHQAIADSWPKSIDDSVARKEWGWKPDYDLPAMTKDMIKKLKAKLAAPGK